VPSVDAVVVEVVVAVVVVVVVMMTVPVVVVMLVVVYAHDGVRLTAAGRVVLDCGRHQCSGSAVTVESGLQELIGGQEMVAGVHQTGRVQRRTERRRLRLMVRRLLLLVMR